MARNESTILLTCFCTWKDIRHFPEDDDEQGEDNVSVSADGGFRVVPIIASTSPLTIDIRRARHVLHEVDFLVVACLACLSTHVISSIREPVG